MHLAASPICSPLTAAKRPRGRTACIGMADCSSWSLISCCWGWRCTTGLYGLRTIPVRVDVETGVEKAVSLVLLVVGWDCSAWAPGRRSQPTLSPSPREPGGSHAAEINFHVTRFNPETDQAPYVKIYPVPVREGHDRARRAALHQGQPGRIAGMALFVPHGHLRLVRHAAETGGRRWPATRRFCTSPPTDLRWGRCRISTSSATWCPT